MHRMSDIICYLEDSGFLKCADYGYLNDCRMRMVYDYIYGHDPKDEKITFKEILDNESLLKILESINLLFITLERGDRVSVEHANGRILFWKRDIIYETSSVERVISILRGKEFFGLKYIILFDVQDSLYHLFKKKCLTFRMEYSIKRS